MPRTSPSSARPRRAPWERIDLVLGPAVHLGVTGWRPKPCASETVMPGTPWSLSAAFTSSTLKGLTIAVMSLSADPPLEPNSPNVYALSACGWCPNLLPPLSVTAAMTTSIALPGSATRCPNRQSSRRPRSAGRSRDRCTAEEHAVGTEAVDRRVGEQAEATAADDAANQVHADHVERVVVASLNLSWRRGSTNAPAMKPMAIGAIPPTKPAHGVMATSPATAPEPAPRVVA